MATGILQINLSAIQRNWLALARSAGNQTTMAAVVKADGYGLGAHEVSSTLYKAGARIFFVAAAEEGVTVRKATGPDADIYVLSGYCSEDAPFVSLFDLRPVLNTPEQVRDFSGEFATRPFALQVNTSMNRLGIEPDDFARLGPAVEDAALIMSHLACSDEPENPLNAHQLATFRQVTSACTAPLSLAATGGMLLGKDYHFDVVRPGIGVYGGLPYAKSEPVVQLKAPVLQTRVVQPGQPVGYGGDWRAPEQRVIATIAIGYADGLQRSLANAALNFFADNEPCPIVGRISMDSVTVDISGLSETPKHLDLFDQRQTINDLAALGSTIPNEILTSLGNRFHRHYIH